MSAALDAAAREKIRADFAAVVNMNASEIESWLNTAESKSVGFVREGETESVGRQSARAIVRILRTKKSALTDDDYAHMRKVIGYVRRHRAQRPLRDITHTRWRYALMNWGHDPVLEDFKR